METAEPLRENELASEQTGREGAYLRHLVQGPWGGTKTKTRETLGPGSARGKGNHFREKIQAV